MSITTRAMLLTSAAGLALALQPMSAQARQAAQQAGPATALEEVVVTAEKREQNLQSTPVAVTAVSGEELAATNTFRLQDAIAMVPSVQIKEANTGGGFYIRGIGARIGGAGSPVSIYSDGVYQSRTELTAAAMLDVARVEVLRGPQGTLYGRNANAGSVNIVSNDPNDEAVEGSVRAGAGNYEAYSFQGAINLPLAEGLAIRLAASRNAHEGYISNGTNDADYNAYRLKVLFEPTEKLRAILSLDHTDAGGHGPGNVFVPLSARSDPWSAPAWTTLNNFGGQAIYCSPKCVPEWDVKATTVSLKVDYDLGFAGLTVIPAFQNFKRDYKQTWAGLYELGHAPQDQGSIEARLASKGDAPLQWVVGAYSLKIDVSGGWTNNFTFTPGGAYNRTLTDVTTTRALFGEATYALSDRLRFTGGLRHTRDTNKILQVNQATGVTTRADGEWKNWTYKAGGQYDLAEAVMLYGQYSTGYKAGGAQESGDYGPEKIAAFELGLKSRFLDNRLQANLAAFAYDYTDYQLSYPIQLANGSYLATTVNLPGSTDVKGVELETSWLVTSNDRIDFSASHLTSSFANVTINGDAPPYAPISLNGRVLPSSPKFSGSLAYEHRFDLAGGGEITVGGDVYYSGSYQVDLLTFNGSRQPAYRLWNAKIGYAAPEGRWTADAYIKNIGDEPVLLQANKAGPNVVGAIGSPRTYGFSLGAKF